MKYYSLPKEVENSNSILINILKDKAHRNIVPFIGAGVSIACGLPNWHDLLSELAVTYLGKKDLPDDDLFAYADKIYNETEEKYGASFDINNRIVNRLQKPDVNKCKYIYTILNGFSNRIITTNYDRCLEKAVHNANGDITSLYSVNDERFDQALQDDKRCIVHIHGNIAATDSIVLNTNSYDKIYGKNNNNGPVVSYLRTEHATKTFLFIGCSLEKDRTLDVLADAFSDHHRRKHYAILEYPGSIEEFGKRNSELSVFGIEPIYFSQGKYEEIGNILNEICSGTKRQTKHHKVLSEEERYEIEHIELGSEDCLETAEGITIGLFEDTFYICNIPKEDKFRYGLFSIKKDFENKYPAGTWKEIKNGETTYCLRDRGSGKHKVFISFTAKKEAYPKYTVAYVYDIVITEDNKVILFK